MHCLGRVSDLGRQEWLSLRRTGLGASDIPAIMGRSPFGTPLSVYAEKVLPVVEEEEADLLKWGRMVQPVIMQWLAEEASIRIKGGDVMFRCGQEPFEFMTATVDGVTTNGNQQIIPVEAKVTAWKERDWDDGVPAYVYLQVQAQMFVLEANECYVVACLGGSPPVWARVARDPEVIADIQAAATVFWHEHVVKGRPPEPEGLKPSSEAIKRLYPGGNEELIPLSAEYNELDIKLQAASEALKNLEKTKRYLTDKIKMAIGDSAGAMLTDGTKFTWKRDKHGVRRFHRSEAK